MFARWARFVSRKRLTVLVFPALRAERYPVIVAGSWMREGLLGWGVA